jgi:type IX secretion system PorP/SprF family membrane protein
MIVMKRYIVFCWLIIRVSSLWGQSDIDLNHHWLWRLDHNPATIKNNGSLEFDVLGRYQWTGFNGAPKTYMVSGSWFHSDINSGFAALAMLDEIGFTQKYGLKGLYSFTFATSKKTSMFALGISGGISQNSIVQNKITTVDDVANSDLITYYLEDTKVKPEFDFGFTYTYRPNSSDDDDDDFLLQLGGSVTHLNQIFDATDYKTSCNYYGYAMATLHFGYLRAIPGVSLVHRGNIPSFEINAMFTLRDELFKPRYKSRNLFKLVKDRLWFGGTLKLKGNEIALFGGINITERFGLGYSSDFTYSSVGNKSRTSHEIMLIIRFPNSRDRNCPIENCPSYRHPPEKSKYNAMFNNFVIY